VSLGSPPGSTPPPAGLQVRTHFWALSFLLALVQTRLEIDGAAPIVRPWGDSFVWIGAGQHTIRGSFRWGLYRRAGDASIVVVVPPGQVLNLDYEAPRWFLFMPGRWTVGACLPLAPAPAAAAALPTAPGPPAGWFADPGGRHQHRYWDGAGWTEHVADAGVAALDPSGA